MKLSCLLGHQWNGCKCARCGAERNEGHNFKPVPNACREKCAVCGKERDTEHVWQGCVCSRCGRSRAIGHNYKPVDDSQIVRCERCGATAVRVDDIAGTDMQAVFLALEARHCGAAQQQIVSDRAADLSALREIQSALADAAGKVNPFNLQAATGVLNGAYGQMTYADLNNLYEKTQALSSVFREKERILSDFAANGILPGKAANEASDNLRQLVTDFATYVNLSMDRSKLDDMEWKLLTSGEAGEMAVFCFLYDCCNGRVGDIRWWSQAKRLTQMLAKFKSPKVKEHLTVLAEGANRTNVWEYHTEIAEVAKQALSQL